MRINDLQIAFLKENEGKYSIEELTNLFNRVFGTNNTVSSIRHYRSRLGLSAGKKGRGLARKVGDERKDKYGMTWIKIAQPGVWVMKQRYIWEQAYGKIPKDHKIIFLDGNHENFSLDNLEIVSKKVACRMCANKLFTNSRELTKSSTLVAEIETKKVEVLKKQGLYEEYVRERRNRNNRKQYQKDKSKNLERQKEYRARNPEKVRAYYREYYQKNKYKWGRKTNDTAL